MNTENERSRARLRLTQETIAIVTVGLALAGLIATSVGDLRQDVSDLREEARADRAAWQAESRQLREEARADRDAFQQEILRLTQADAALSERVARIEHTRHAQ